MKGYRRRTLAPGVTKYTARRSMDRYETDSPWITFRFRWTDGWSRLLGRTGVAWECLICRQSGRWSARIPRFGPVPIPPGGKHPKRLAVIEAHAHPGKRGNPLLWSKPLGNPDAFRGREATMEDVIRERVVVHPARFAMESVTRWLERALLYIDPKDPSDTLDGMAAEEALYTAAELLDKDHGPTCPWCGADRDGKGREEA